MSNYVIEEDIDFYKELHATNASESVDNICLITNQPLTDKYITMLCRHKFNYVPLYNDLVNYKSHYNKMESSTNMLKDNEIRCPYCRKKQSVLLPYYKNLGCKKVAGINAYKDESGAYTSKCEYKCVNKLHDPTSPDIGTNSKFFICGMIGASMIKVYDSSHPLEPTNYGDQCMYCCKHKKQMIKYYQKIETQKQKQLEKQEQKAAKQLAKQLAKEAFKQKEKIKKSGSKCEDYKY